MIGIYWHIVWQHGVWQLSNWAYRLKVLERIMYIRLIEYLDFSKAFNTINYHILFAKLYHYGIWGCLLDWFKSYLTDRKQYVYFDGYSSSMQTVSFGVPQGSILGPLLFVIYVNDLATVSEHILSILLQTIPICSCVVKLYSSLRKNLMQKWERFSMDSNK